MTGTVRWVGGEGPGRLPAGAGKLPTDQRSKSVGNVVDESPFPTCAEDRLVSDHKSAPNSVKPKNLGVSAPIAWRIRNGPPFVCVLPAG
jgi:hypothetical protein